VATTASARALLAKDAPAEALRQLEDAARTVGPDTEGLAELNQLIGKAREQTKKKQARDALEKVLVDAQKCLDAGDGQTPVASLREALQIIAADTPRYAEIQPLLDKAQELTAAQRVRARYAAFARLLFAQDWEKCQAFVDPEARMKYGAGGIQFRLQIILGVAKLLKLTENQVRVQQVRFQKERTTADVIAAFFLNSEWKEQPPSRWRRDGDEWYVVLD
jgi:hypothetical protein